MRRGQLGWVDEARKRPGEQAADVAGGHQEKLERVEDHGLRGGHGEEACLQGIAPEEDAPLPELFVARKHPVRPGIEQLADNPATQLPREVLAVAPVAEAADGDRARQACGILGDGRGAVLGLRPLLLALGKHEDRARLRQGQGLEVLHCGPLAHVVLQAEVPQAGLARGQTLLPLRDGLCREQVQCGVGGHLAVERHQEVAHFVGPADHDEDAWEPVPGVAQVDCRGGRLRRNHRIPRLARQYPPKLVAAFHDTCAQPLLLLFQELRGAAALFGDSGLVWGDEQQTVRRQQHALVRRREHNLLASRLQPHADGFGKVPAGLAEAAAVQQGHAHEIKLVAVREGAETGQAVAHSRLRGHVAKHAIHGAARVDAFSHAREQGLKDWRRVGATDLGQHAAVEQHGQRGQGHHDAHGLEVRLVRGAAAAQEDDVPRGCHAHAEKVLGVIDAAPVELHRMPRQAVPEVGLHLPLHLQLAAVREDDDLLALRAPVLRLLQDLLQEEEGLVRPAQHQHVVRHHDLEALELPARHDAAGRLHDDAEDREVVDEAHDAEDECSPEDRVGVVGADTRLRAWVEEEAPGDPDAVLPGGAVVVVAPV
mmetsp:Transcript_24155/g.75177  ORF Transcript_24155/g.75177 Transcript_24155/m.75177 type:complete len:596 (-) Transcript_24155:123-1910(-)